MQKECNVSAIWDEEARMWVAEGVNVPGLCTEAETMELLMDKLKTMIPEMLEANGLLSNHRFNVPYALTSTIRGNIQLNANSTS